MRRFKREIALSLVGLFATVIGFAAGPVWGWRVLGALMLLAAGCAFAISHAAYLVPGFKPGYLAGRAAGAVALANAAIGLALLAEAKALAAWTYRACRALPVAACAPVCANNDVLAVASPSRSIRAVRFVRSCDTIAGVSTQVSIVAMGEALGDGPGNAFIVDGRTDLTLLWIDARHLAIAGAGGASPRLQQTYVNGVRISYGDPRR